MNPWVQITFQCVPLRSVGRLTPPIDVPSEVAAAVSRLHAAARQHGFHNSYYLSDGRCIYHLTNHEELGALEFSFEGTVLTDAADLKTLQCDLHVELVAEVCPWLEASVTNWFADSVREAVKVEFDRFIMAGDVNKTVQRLEEIRVTSESQGGYLGLGL